MSSDKTTQPLSAERVAALKREAQQLKQTSGETHANILRKLARREGFKNWEELLRASSNTQTPPVFTPPPMKDLPVEQQGDKKRFLFDEGFGIMR